MALFINWFKTAISIDKGSFPTKDFSCWEETSALLRSDEMQGFQCYREQGKGGVVSLVVLNGPTKPVDWPERDYNFRDNPVLGGEIIERSISEYLRRKNVPVFRTQWGVYAMRRDDNFHHEGIALFYGIAFKFYQPDEGESFGLSMSWEVKAEFHTSLADAKMKRLALGAGVILKLPKNEWNGDARLKKYNHRFLGIVERFVGEEDVEVASPDNTVYQVPANLLYLEAKPDVIKAFENQVRIHDQSKSAWMKIQQLSFVLAKGGRRNPSVLKDRMRAIRDFVSPGADEFIVTDLCAFGGGQVTLDLRPTMIPMEVGV